MAEQTSSQSSTKGKRKRDPNMVYNEKSSLLELVRKYFDIIENKKTDVVSVVKKNEVWEKIRVEFNSLSSVPRTTDTLKNTWKNLKADARKKAAEERQSRMKTGGGPTQVILIDPLLMEVLELIQCGAVGLLSPFDSDGAFDNATSADTSGPTTQNVEDPNHHLESRANMVDFMEDIAEDVAQLSEQDRPVNGDWGQYSTTKLRTPKTQILKELPHCNLEVDEDGHLKVLRIEGSNLQAAGSSGKISGPRRLQPLHVTPSTSRGNIKKVYQPRRRPPVLVDNQQLIEAKLKAITSAEAQATEEHEINMKIKAEQLKQEQLKTAGLLLDLKIKKQQYLSRH